MDFNAVCRTCLCTSNLNRIFKNADHLNLFPATLHKVTGIKIAENDGLPQNICRACLHLIKSYLRFRAKCKKTQNKLLLITRNDITSNHYISSPNTEEKTQFIPNVINNRIKKFNTKYLSNRRTESNNADSLNTLPNTNISIKPKDSHTNQKDSVDINLKNNHKDINAEVLDKIDYLNSKLEEILPIVNMYNESEVEGAVQNINDDKLNYCSDSDDNPLSHLFEVEDNDKDDLNNLPDKVIDISSNKRKFDNENKELLEIDIKQPYNIKKPDVHHIDNSKSKETILNCKLIKKTLSKKTSKHNNLTDATVIRSLQTTEDVTTDITNKTDANKPTNNDYKILHDLQIKHEEIELSEPDSKEKEQKTKDSLNKCKKILSITNHTTKIDHDTIEIEYKIKRVNCEICRMDLAASSLRYHMNKKHPDINNLKCEYCNTYVARRRMQRHIEIQHGIDCCKCKYCQREFESKDVLLEHVQSCISLQKSSKKKLSSKTWGKEMTECEVCNKKMQRASLKLHMRVKHAGLGPVCDYCGRKLGNKLRLNEHMRSKHGYAKFTCPDCDFQSASMLSMKNHERRHRGEKPFVCEMCGASFHAAYLLAQHKQSHRTERLLKCDLCPASFKTNNSLHTHRAACHGAARHACPLCARAYSCRHYVVRHMRAVHRYAGNVPSLKEKQ